MGKHRRDQSTGPWSTCWKALKKAAAFAGGIALSVLARHAAEKVLS